MPSEKKNKKTRHVNIANNGSHRIGLGLGCSKPLSTIF